MNAFAAVGIAWWHWLIFVGGVTVFLALDLGWFHRGACVVRVKEALLWTAGWMALALLFGALLELWRGRTEALQFFTGYLLELALSLDNVFVMALIFSSLSIPLEYQHRVLCWGLLGALALRGVLIGLGAALVAALSWMLYVLGAFVLFTGVRVLFVQPRVTPEKHWVLRLARRFFPVTPGLDGQRFVTRWQGTLALTPLAMALLMVETADLVCAMDSIPAIFAVTTKPFIMFTSNVFAILCLRSVYSVLAGAIRYFRFLKAGLSAVLIFIGAKMLLDPHGQPARGLQVEIPLALSLAVVAGIVLLAAALSVLAAYLERRRDSGEA